MRKRSFAEKLCALMLVFVMILTSTGVDTLAEEIQLTQSEAQTVVPETETQTQKMLEADDEKQTQDTESVTTEAPEPVKEVGSDEADVTETTTESTEATTEAILDMESETETEEEPEVPKTYFTYEDSRVSITANAPEEANLPQDAVLKADYLVPGSAEYKDAAAAISAQLSEELCADAEGAKIEYVLYDIYFYSKELGVKIEPEAGNVNVEMTFNKVQESDTEGEVINKDVVHLKDNGTAEIVTDYINTNVDGEVTSMGFTQDSFSIVGAAVTSQADVQERAAEGTVPLEPFITDIKITDFVNEKVDLTEVKFDESFKVNIKYKVGRDDLSTGGVWNGNLTYQIPPEIALAKELSGPVKDGAGNEVGNYIITKEGHITIHLEESKFNSGTEINGAISFEGRLSSSIEDTQGSVNITWTAKNETPLTVIRPKQIGISKSCEKGEGKPDLSYDEKTGIITYNYKVEITSEQTGTDNVIDLNDNVSTICGKDFTRTAPTIVKVMADGTQIPFGGYNWDNLTATNANIKDLPKLEKGEKYVITYSTSEYIGTGKLNGKFEEKNTATASTVTKYAPDAPVTATATSNPWTTIKSEDYTDIGVEKNSTDPTADTETGTITWHYTVKVSSENGTNGQIINFTDTLAQAATGTDRTPKNIKVTKGDGNTPVTGASLNATSGKHTEANTEIINGTLPALKAGEYYTISYDVVETGIPSDKAGWIKGDNKAKITTTDYPDGKEDTSNPTVEYIGKEIKPSIDKSGNPNNEKTEITWTIKVNENKYASLDGYELTDELFKNGEKEENVTFVCTVTDTNKENQSQTFEDVTLPVSFHKNGDKTIMTDASGKDYELKSDKDALVFTYKTEVDTTLSNVTYKNKGKLDDRNNPGGPGISEPDVTINQPLVDKQITGASEKADADGNVTLDWTSTVRIPDEGIGTDTNNNFFQDTVSNAVVDGKVVHYLTRDQVRNLNISGLTYGTDWVLGGVWEITETGIVWSPFHNVSQYSDINTAVDNIPASVTKIAGFQIKFLRKIEKTETLQAFDVTYSTTGYLGDLNAWDNRTFKNDAYFKVNGTDYRDHDEKTYTGNGQGEETGKLVEKGHNGGDSYVYDENGTMLYYRVVLNVSGTATGDITYTDTFPENTSFDPKKNWEHNGVKYEYNEWYQTDCFDGIRVNFIDLTDPSAGESNSFLWTGAKQLGITVNQEAGRFTVNVPEDAYIREHNGQKHNAQIILYYALEYTKPAGTVIDKDHTIILENTGHAKCDTDEGTDSTKSEVQAFDVDKAAGQYDGTTHTLSYTVTFAENNVPEGTKKDLVATDTMTYAPYHEDGGRGNRIKSVSILPGSAKLYYLDGSGQKVYIEEEDQIQFEDHNETGNCVITARLPYDGKTYYLDYTYLFEFATTKPFNIGAINDVKISGMTSDKWDSHVETEFEDSFSDASATTDRTNITLAKIEKGNAANALKGAVFTLEQWDGSDWIKIGDFTTDDTGSVKLGEPGAEGEDPFIRYNYLYRLEEIKAPFNYEPKTGYSYIYIDAEQEGPALPADFDLTQAEKIINKKYIYIEDEKASVGNIDVVKKWKDAAGNDLENHPDQITVQLWQIPYGAMLPPQGEKPYDTAILNNDNSWKASFNDLPLEVNDSKVRYLVTETMTAEEAENYDTVIAPAGGITSGTIEITNTSKKQELGSLEITKSFEGDVPELTEEQKKEIVFTVEGPDYNKEITYDLFTDGTYTLSNLPFGDYTVTEKTGAVDGYIVKTTYNVEQGKVTVSEGQPAQITVTNTYTKTVGLKVSKVDIADGTELEGATLQVVDKDGKVVKEWTSSKDGAEEITGLVPGEEYTLKETVAPEGYDKITTDIKFTVDEDGNVTVTYTDQKNGKDEGTAEDNVLLVNDDKTKVGIKVSKVDIADGTELEGATLQVVDKDGKVVKEWTSSKDGAEEITGLVPGEEYTLKETVAPEGYDKITTDIKFTVDKDGKVTVTQTGQKDGKDEGTAEDNVLLVNDDKTKVGIKVSKVDIADGTELEGAILQVVDKDGKVVKEWTSSKDGAEEITGLVPGEEYTLKETVAPEGYDKITTDIKFTVDKDGKVTVTQTGQKDGKDEGTVKDNVLLVNDDKTKEQPEVGKLIVTKAVEGATLTDEQKAAISFKVTYPDGTTEKTNTYDKFTDGSWTLENLPAGEYKVEEIGGAVEGYTVETTYSVDGGKVTVEAGKTAEITITNTYKEEGPKVGKLVVTKSFAGDELTDEQKAAINFTVTDSKDYTETKFYADFTNGSWTIENLPAGTYTVTETNEAVSGYSVETTYSVNGGEAATVESQNVDVADGKTTEVEVTNTYTQHKGSLEITKNFAGTVAEQDLTEAQKEAIVFKVTGDGYEKEIKYSEFTDGKYTITDLPVGEYKVTETAAGEVNGNHATASYNVTGGRIQVEANVTGKVTVTNTYSKDVGKLIVTKSFKGATLTDAQKNKVIFTVTGPDGYKNSKRYETFTDGSWTLENLPIGTYTVTETNETVEGYTVVKEYSVANGEAQIRKDQTTELTVTNTYTRDTANLVVTKSFAGDELTDEQKAAITFTVTGPDSFHEEKTYDQFINGSWTLRDLPTGEYRVTEEGEVEGYTLETTYSVANGQTTLMKNQDAQVKVTNTYTRIISIKVSKVDIADGTELEGAILQVVDKDGNVVKEWTSRKDGAEEITGLVPGEEYTLKETVAPFGYDKITTDIKFTVDKDGKVTVTQTGKKDGKDEGTVKDGVLLVNDMAKPQEGSLKVRKVLKYQGEIVKMPASLEIGLFTDKEGTNLYRKETFDMTEGPVEVTFDKLPAGTYYVYELDFNGNVIKGDKGLAGTLGEFDFEAAITVSRDGTVELAEGQKDKDPVVVVNDYPDLPEGYTKVNIEISGTKTWVDDDNAYGVRPDTLILSLNDGTQDIELQSDDATAPYYLEWSKPEDSNEWTYTIKNVPKVDGDGNLIEYTVIEETVEDYESESDITSGERDEKGNIVNADFINTLTTVSVGISKVDFTDGTALAGAVLEVEDQYGNVTELTTTEDGVDEITGLIPGEEYTLRETVAPFGYNKITKEIKFTVDEEGNVTVTDTGKADGKDEGVVEENILVIKDTAKPREGSLKVRKVLKLKGEVVMMPATFEIGLFTDKEGTNLYRKETFDMTEGPAEVTFDHLPEGTYYVYELDSFGDAITEGTGYAGDLGEFGFEATITVSRDGKVELAEGQKEEDPVVVVNDYPDLPEGYTKVNIEISGTKTWVDDNNSHKVRPDSLILTLNDGTQDIELQSDDETAPYYIEWSKPEGSNEWTYTIKNVPKVDGDGNLIEYTVTEESVENYESESDISFGERDENNNIIHADFTNTYEEESATTTATTEKTKTTTGTTVVTVTGKSTTSAKTGDTTDSMLYLLLLATAAVFGVNAWYTKKRTKENK